MRRALRVLFVGVPLSLMALVLFEQPAAAQSVTGCTATLNGKDHKLYNTPKRALKVRHDQSLAVSGTALDLFYSPGESRALSYLVKLELAGASWTVTSGVSSSQTWSGTVKVADYATRGQGIYKVVAVTQSSQGTQCFGRAYVKVEGDGGALSTTAGQVAAGVGAVGLAGAFAAGAKGSKEVDDVVDQSVVNFLEEQAGPPEDTAAADAKAAREELERRHAHELHLMAFCLPLVVVAAVATIKAIASDIARNVIASIGGLIR